MPKILIVDDDENITKALRIRLEKAKYEVVVGHDGVSGMRLAVQEQPDLILLDISMPAGNGFSLARKLRDHDSTLDTPIIFMTASKGPGLADGADDFDAVQFFEKPFESTKLLSTISDTLESRPVTT